MHHNSNFDFYNRFYDFSDFWLGPIDYSSFHFNLGDNIRDLCYYVLCWATSGQTLAQKSWGLRITNGNGTQVSMRTAFKRFLLSTLFNLTMIAPTMLLFTKHNQYPQDQLLNTQVTVNDEVRNQV